MRIDLCIPTRGRPELLYRAVSSAFQTAANPDDVRVLLRFDHDDQTIGRAMDLLTALPDTCRIDASTGNRLRIMSDLWNELYRQGSGEILWHGNDDMWFATNGWDAMVRDQFRKWPDMIGMVFGNDRYQGDQLAVCSFTSRKAADIMGTWLPPYFSSCYNDTWLDETYRTLHRAKYIHQLEVVHEHWGKDAAHHKLHDETYAYRDQLTPPATEEWNARRREIHTTWVPKLKEHMR